MSRVVQVYLKVRVDAVISNEKLTDEQVEDLADEAVSSVLMNGELKSDDPKVELIFDYSEVLHSFEGS